MTSRRIGAQPGPQEAFLKTRADIAIYGGAAGGGKSYALLLEPLRHVTKNPNFSAVFFRRNTTQLMGPGSLWDVSAQIYPYVGGTPKVGPLEWTWPKGGKIKFAHLEHEQSKLSWTGTQITLIGFDELTTFTESQFWFLLTRNRSMSGVKGYIRATCNPEADTWVARLIDWWIDPDTGYPIPERANVLRWFVRINDTLFWSDTREGVIDQCRGMVDEKSILPKSLTFIPAKLSDNKILTDCDPSYLANLLAQTTVERERYLEGNWKIRPAAGLYFQRKWLKPIDIAPVGTVWARGWDLAATPKTALNDPDYTESVLLGRMPNGNFVIADHTYLQGSPEAVRSEILRIAKQDKALGYDPTISIPQDPAQSGKVQAADFTRLLLGFNIRTSIESRMTPGTVAAPSAKAAKIARFGPFSAQCEGGFVYFIPSRQPNDWNTAFFDRLEAFPEGRKDDCADATSRAFSVFLQQVRGESMLTLARQQLDGVKNKKEPEKVTQLWQPGSVEHSLAEARRLAAEQTKEAATEVAAS